MVVFDPMDVNYSTNLPVLPENHRKPWVKSGTIVPAFSESPYRYLRIEDTDAGDKVYYSRSLSHKIYPGTSFMFEVDIQIEANNELGADSTSCLRFFLHDGRKAFGVAIGDNVDLIDTAGLKLDGNPNTLIDKTKINKIRIWKWENKGIYLYINDDFIDSIPWQNAETIAFTRMFQWGIFDNAGNATFNLYFLQYASGTDFARTGFFNRTLNVPTKFVKRNQILKAIVHGMTQQFQLFKNRVAEIELFMKPSVYIVEEGKLYGDVLPDAMTEPWTAAGTEVASIERNSIKIVDDDITANKQYTWTLPDINTYYDIELYWTLEVHDGWVSAGGAEVQHFGPFVELHDGTKAIHVTWRDVNDKRMVGLSNGTLTVLGTFVTYGEQFVLDPRKEHSFKLFKSYNSEVWLAVDGVIRCVAQYSSFPNSAAEKIVWGSTTASTSTTWWKNFSWRVSLAGNKVSTCDFIPFASNLILRQRMMDWLIFPNFKEIIGI